MESLIQINVVRVGETYTIETVKDGETGNTVRLSGVDWSEVCTMVATILVNSEG